MSMVVYAFLAAAMAVVFISIWYYWNYARKIDEFLVRDNQNNNMMRQDLVDRYARHLLSTRAFLTLH